jgi:hypothetical protein
MVHVRYFEGTLHTVYCTDSVLMEPSTVVQYAIVLPFSDISLSSHRGLVLLVVVKPRVGATNSTAVDSLLTKK